MARRYSGNVVIRVTWSDADVQYAGRVTTPEGGVSMTVRAPAFTKLAVDSPEAYDLAASAMLSLAETPLAKMGIGLDAHALFEPDGSGWTVKRRKDHDYRRVLS